MSRVKKKVEQGEGMRRKKRTERGVGYGPTSCALPVVAYGNTT